jgi:hypothetical protein
MDFSRVVYRFAAISLLASRMHGRMVPGTSDLIAVGISM